MNLLACLPLSLTLPTSIHIVHAHTGKCMYTNTHTKALSCLFTHMHAHTQTHAHSGLVSMHRHCTHSYFIPHRYLNKSFDKSQSSHKHTHTHTRWHLWQTVLRRVSPGASIKAIDMNLGCFLHTGSSSNIPAVLFSSYTSFIRACAWKIAVYSRPHPAFLLPLLHRDRRYCWILALALAEPPCLISEDIEWMREAPYFIWKREAGRCRKGRGREGGRNVGSERGSP